MFEDTLLIIKSDYMMKRKALLKHLLAYGFQIQGHRKLLFTPELAAEFYQDQTDQPHFMMFVIMLSKGISEAFILTKENAIEDLLNTMVCYFGTSIEMERNIHVTKCARVVRREISFIFPNYIHEPIYCPDQWKFCKSNPIMRPLVEELYEIVVNKDIEPHKNWKIKLSEFFERANPALPRVSNMCASKSSPNLQEQAQQTLETSFKYLDGHYMGSGSTTPRSADMSYTTAGSTLDMSSSSCLSCSKFGSGDVCIQQARPTVPLVDLIKAKTAPLKLSSPTVSDHKIKEQVSKECVISKSKMDLLAFEEEEEDKIKPTTPVVVTVPSWAPSSQTSMKIDEIKSEIQTERHIEPQEETLPPISGAPGEDVSKVTFAKEMVIEEDVEVVKEAPVQAPIDENTIEVEGALEVAITEEPAPIKDAVTAEEQSEQIKQEEEPQVPEAPPDAAAEATPKDVPAPEGENAAVEPQPEAPTAPIE